MWKVKKKWVCFYVLILVLLIIRVKFVQSILKIKIWPTQFCKIKRSIFPTSSEINEKKSQSQSLDLSVVYFLFHFILFRPSVSYVSDKAQVVKCNEKARQLRVVSGTVMRLCLRASDKYPHGPVKFLAITSSLSFSASFSLHPLLSVANSTSLWSLARVIPKVSLLNISLCLENTTEWIVWGGERSCWGVKCAF